MTTIHPEPERAARIEQKLDNLIGDMAYVKGQFDVISPKDMAKLQVRVERQDVRVGYLSAGVSAIIGLIISFFKGGSA